MFTIVFIRYVIHGGNLVKLNTSEKRFLSMEEKLANAVQSSVEVKLYKTFNIPEDYFLKF